MEKLIGREQEIKLLKEYTSSERPEFVAIYGRRRVGKTYLVNQTVQWKDGLCHDGRTQRHQGGADGGFH